MPACCSASTDAVTAPGGRESLPAGGGSFTANTKKPTGFSFTFADYSRYSPYPVLPGPRSPSLFTIIKDGGMNSRYLISFAILLAFFLTATNAHAQFKKGAHYIGVGATLTTDPIAYGVTYENGFDANIGLGLNVRYFGREKLTGMDNNAAGSYSLERSMILPMIQGLYHVRLIEDQVLDAFGGARLGYAFASQTWTESGVVTGVSEPDPVEDAIQISILAGARYFFSQKFSLEADFEYFLTDIVDYQEKTTGSDLGITLGVNFTIE
jgi:hypothetical protein